MMRVAFILHVMQVAGAEVLVAETIRRLRTHFEFTVLCLDGIGPLGEQLQDEGIPVLCMQRRPGRDWRVAWRLAREFRARHIDVVHAHQYTPFFYGGLARLLLPDPPRLIFTEHGRHFPDVASPLRRALNRLLLDRVADEVNAVCAFSGRSLTRVDGFSGRRIEVIQNGIELARYRPVAERSAARRALGLDPARRYIANVARFHPVKDHPMLLRAFQLVAAKRVDVDLLLAGDGPLRSDLEQLARDLGIAGRVHFLGVRRDVPALLQAAEVFALTSVSEAASLTLLEAMASGLPVVVTDVGGNPEIVRPEVDGILVPRGDHAAAGVALLRLLDNPEAAASMGASGRARVQAHYQLQQTIDRYGRLYQRLGPAQTRPAHTNGHGSLA